MKTMLFTEERNFWKFTGTSLAFGLLLGMPLHSLAAMPEKEPREIMGQIFAAMRVLLPMSAHVEQLQDLANRKSVRPSLSQISKSADEIMNHGRYQQQSVQFLSRSLGRNAREALTAYDLGRYDATQFHIQRMTEHCIACHSRLPSGDSPLAADFVKGPELAAMGPASRGAIQVATRRFDGAFVTFEALFQNPKEHPAMMLKPLRDYLTVAIRVKKDFSRAIQTLDKFAQRPDLWKVLRADVDNWGGALREIRGTPRPEDHLDAARELVEKAHPSNYFPGTRGALIYFITASSHLHQYLDANPADKNRVSEAYYLLGITEFRIARDYWLSLADFYLETAIRTAPESASAHAAYDLLEEETILGYTGSSGTHMPDDVAAHLKELRALVARE